jgi:Zn-dependent protease with chaperone function
VINVCLHSDNVSRQVYDIQNYSRNLYFFEIIILYRTQVLKKGIAGLFSTHPPIEKRIKVLEQF